MSKLLENKQLIHIASEIVVLSGMFMYVSNINNKLTSRLEALTERLDEQESIIQTQNETITKLVNRMNGFDQYKQTNEMFKSDVITMINKLDQNSKSNPATPKQHKNGNNSSILSPSSSPIQDTVQGITSGGASLVGTTSQPVLNSQQPSVIHLQTTPSNNIPEMMQQFQNMNNIGHMLQPNNITIHQMPTQSNKQSSNKQKIQLDEIKDGDETDGEVDEVNEEDSDNIDEDNLEQELENELSELQIKN